MKKNLESIIAEYKGHITDFSGMGEVIASLHAKGLSIIDTMKVIMKLYGVSLRDVKPLVTNHPVWAKTVEAHQLFHDELARIMMQKDNLPAGITVEGEQDSNGAIVNTYEILTVDRSIHVDDAASRADERRGLC